jgi:type IV fimbrial biogenesis protein FimT
MQKQHGLTLIELMVVLAISAILAFLAAPSFTSAIRSNAISSSVNTFLSDMRYARSEAIRLGGGVVLCRSDAPEEAAPACGTGHGPGGNGWVSGWFIFHDLDNDGAWDAGERILRVQAASSSPDQILEDGAGSSTLFRFTATGRLLSSASATTMRFGSTANGDARRTVCVGVSGRARVDSNGSAVCE